MCHSSSSAISFTVACAAGLSRDTREVAHAVRRRSTLTALAMRFHDSDGATVPVLAHPSCIWSPSMAALPNCQYASASGQM
jgi:hypothetical protein